MNQTIPIFLSAFIWAIIGLLSTLKWGFDAPKFIIDIITFVIIPGVFILFGGYKDIDKVTNFTIFYINMLPGAIIGDIVGSLVARLEEPIRILLNLAKKIKDLIENIIKELRRIFG